MSTEINYPHITWNDNSTPCIDDTRHRVIDIAADHLVHGYSAMQIVDQYPDLTPAQVHTALAYYYDHQDEINSALMTSYEQAEKLRRQHSPHPKLLNARK